MEVNLPDQTITILATGEKESFDINGYKKHNMINGFDDIDYLQAMKKIQVRCILQYKFVLVNEKRAHPCTSNNIAVTILPL